MISNNDDSLKEISSKLDVLIRLTALTLVKNMKTQKEQIVLLAESGFQPKQIADILGTTNNVVSVTLTTVKKKHETLAVSKNNMADKNNMEIKESEQK